MSVFNIENLSLGQLKALEPSEYESYQASINIYRQNSTPENMKTWDDWEKRYMSLLEEINQREEFKDLQ